MIGAVKSIEMPTLIRVLPYLVMFIGNQSAFPEVEYSVTTNRAIKERFITKNINFH